MSLSSVINYVDERDAAQKVRDAFEPALALLTGDRAYMKANPKAVNGLGRLSAAAEAVDGALKSLGKRDRDGVKAFLESLRTTYASALQAFESVGRSCDGPAALEIIAALDAVSAELSSARISLANAPAEVEALTKANVTLQLAQARARDVNARLNKLFAACALPPIDSNLIEAIAVAKDNAAKIVRLAKAAPARALHEALDQGAAVQPRASAAERCR